MQRLLNNAVTRQDKTEQKLAVSAAFSSVGYRFDFCERTHSLLAYNQGYAAASQVFNRRELIIETAADPCDQCIEKAKTIINIKPGQNLSGLIPPWHPNCLCKVRVK